MPRPRRGVGEHLIKKSIVLSTSIFFVSLPICMAEQAKASVSYSSFERLPQLQSQIGIPRQIQNLPRSYRDLLSPTLVVPSLDDLNNLNSTLEDYQSQLKTLKNSKAKDPLNDSALSTAISAVESKISELKDKIALLQKDITNVEKSKALLAKALETYSSAQLAVNNAQSALIASNEALALATALKTQQETIVANAKDNLTVAQSDRQIAIDKRNSADASLTSQKEVKASALADLQSSQNNLTTAEQNLAQAQQTLNEAQSNYNTLLIPDPNWTPLTHEVAYTRLVPVTTTITTGGVTAKSYNRQGYNNAPPLPTSNEQPIATTTVDNISFQWGGGYVLNSGRSEDVIVEFTGVITVPTTGYYKFYAPGDDGVQFFINGNRIINDWYDKGGGGSVSQDVYLEAGKSNTFTLYFYENGGGANVWLYYYTPNTGYQIVPASWLGQNIVTETTYVEETYYVTEVIPGQTHPLIHDPSLFPAVEEAQANLAVAQENYDSAVADKTSKEATYNQESSKTDELQATFNEASLKLTNKELILSNAEATYAIENNKLSILNSDEQKAITNNELSKGTLTNSQLELEGATSNKEQAEATLTLNEDSASSSASSAVEASTKIQPLLDSALEIANKEPEPQPEPEPTGSPDIPAVIEDLMDIDLEAVDPTELTPEQAQQLVEAALETFETAPEGSPEYQQALDALYLAAQEDDIVLSEDIANIPGVGAAAQAVVAVFNIVGNVGADISPKARKKAQTLVVTTLVVGQIAQTAAIAQATSGGSFRRRS